MANRNEVRYAALVRFKQQFDRIAPVLGGGPTGMFFARDRVAQGPAFGAAFNRCTILIFVLETLFMSP